ncbi:hypothetical protein [Rhodospirillum rubrum]|uniref:Uncharacterized protein n=1 Tax=Rhodospirillum rubrum (strain ATCC 11170 / ATH 1.1.1 / DSM 467 / LMG 4362 / NCIMB 8255 / S1) TaxID=269796 RepID=Q2RR66_RHORT|nr:hypothetical protein [Rhodospirillum rubrum]ABC23379.1 hypothetical protein Rru_A2582 [Rhodospirillum rubrum ATCC 11170]AEO49114.1 hypothetical protein F11_13260 [Rhodospirillum rubrum F11]MBK5955024.1 hypothetical protein [Rhodospirillum rubrum]QXG79352.1 hypothetical protein KUL73_13320 [Rhodospirillum rubrum]
MTPSPPPPDSGLEIDGPALLQKWSARGTHHVLTPLPRGEFWRDQEGTARFAALPGTKYALALSASDVRPPAFASLWPGIELRVTCAARLGAVLAPGIDAWTAERPFVAGDVAAFDGEGADYRVVESDGMSLRLAPHAGAVCVMVRPILTMMVRDWSLGLLEWEGRHPWRLLLEEV